MVFAPGCVNYKKGALDSQSQVIKFTSYLPMVGGSLWVLRLLPSLKLVAMVELKVALNTKIQIYLCTVVLYTKSLRRYDHILFDNTHGEQIYIQFYLGFENTRVANERHHINIVNLFLKVNCVYKVKFLILFMVL